MKEDFSAGGIVFKKDKKGVKVLLIQPHDTTRPEGWSLPKGHIEEDEDVEEGALREVEEETGIKAEVVSKVGDIGYFFKLKGKTIKKKVTYYLMEYKSGNPSLQPGETRAVQWFLFNDALEKMAYDNEREVLEKAIELLEAAR